MAKWKLNRQKFGSEEFMFLDGDEVTVGRGINNTITLSSIVVSRNHCVINVQKDKVLITDLKSSNGIYVGLKKIPQNVPYTLQDSDIIGFGWTIGAPVANINDNEKYVFKLVKEKCATSVTDRIQFQSDTELEELEEKIAALDARKLSQQTRNTGSPKQQLKRKLENHTENFIVKKEVKKEQRDVHIKIGNNDIINISDSENEVPLIQDETAVKKPRLEPVCDELLKEPIKFEHFKTERDDLEYEAFNVKQEYSGYDDEAIQCDSDSDSGSESDPWLLRLSQSSPGKPFIKVPRESKIVLKQEESSYSQLDDYIDLEDDENDEEFEDDLISIPHHPADDKNKISDENVVDEIRNKDPQVRNQIDENEGEEFVNDLITLEKSQNDEQVTKTVDRKSRDEVDGGSDVHLSKEIETSSATVTEIQNEKVKRTQMIEPLILLPRKKITTIETKIRSPYKQRKDKKHTTSKKHDITNSQKEERKKKLKEIATKEKEECEQKSKRNSSSSRGEKAVPSVKITASNRGAFLTDVVQGVVKPMKRKESPQKSVIGKEKSGETSPKDTPENKHRESVDADIENKKKQTDESKTKKHQNSKRKDKQKHSKTKTSDTKPMTSSNNSDARVPLKSLKPLTESEESFSGKPFSKVEPLRPNKPKKTVRFSEAGPMVHVFEIEDGNKMKKTSLVKTSLVDVHQTPVFSLKKITLMKILIWNPQWLDEQMNNNEPPPILGHNNPPMTIFHSFPSHKQYVQLVGDLLLMEIWECLTQSYMRVRGHNNGIQMRIASLPPVQERSQDRCFELFNLSVDISLTHNEARNVPRMGEIMIVAFGPETARTRRFFFVHNVRCLPSPPNNIRSFYNISLHACFTDKMKSLKPGELMIGVSLSFINKELLLFEAMEYLAGSPLSEAILRPEPRHFVKCDPNSTCNMNSQWIKTLNPSQQVAVNSSVSAALGDRPAIQMVQGPPGTGKSSVICAIVMSYFYDSHDRRQPNRGKILICATSNAAVDGLVIRLLCIRQNLQKSERFRMVRVGRTEAMHPRARDVSSQQLAQRDAARLNSEPGPPGLAEEISHLEAKINMWKTQTQNVKDPVRVAYCQKQVAQVANRIALLRSGSGCGKGGGDEIRADQLAQTERRIIEGADIIVTTLASAQNNKMRGLKRRVALCIIDEAGQAIEPETLIPLTLDVTKLTLIGDPQQLPGFICSQRAKKHGLGESLFSRLTSRAEHWPEGSPVVLLNQQYRMHREIADYPNRAFYGARIQTVDPVRPDLPVPPYSIISISSGDKGQGANEMEAWGVSRLVIALNAKLRTLNLSLAVITPYNAHKDLIKKNLRMLQDPSESIIEVNTVDSFQGQERDVMVVSLARSQGVGFLTDAGRMNVMLTRARHALLVCLNPHAMLKNHQWRTLVEDAQNRNLYRILPNKMCQPLSAAQTPSDDILKYITYHKSNSYK